jgi:hypothetical protein
MTEIIMNYRKESRGSVMRFLWKCAGDRYLLEERLIPTKLNTCV